MKVGDKVKLISERFPDEQWDPRWGGNYGFVEGIITSIYDRAAEPVTVKWNGNSKNTYNYDDLELIFEPLKGLIDFINETLVI